MNDYDYESQDALGLAELLRRGEVTPTELLDAALVRVEEHNSAINAVVHRMEDSARQEIAAGLPNGPFKGVPYLLKDLYLLAAGEPTSNGSGLYHESVPDHDSTLTKRLRAAGLVPWPRPTHPSSVSTSPLSRSYTARHVTLGISPDAPAARAAGPRRRL